MYVLSSVDCANKTPQRTAEEAGVRLIAFGGAAAKKGQGALNAFDMGASSCHFLGLDGLGGERRTAYGLALDWGDDEGECGECGEWVRASGAGAGG
jgi:hypothetical protein